MALSDNLANYYALGEASGNALDSVGSFHLTETGTIASATGKVGNCRDFDSGATQYFTYSDDAQFEVGDTDFTLAAWVKLENKTLSQFLGGKFNNTGNQRSYSLYYSSATDRFEAAVSANGSTATVAVANNFGSPTAGVWYFVVTRHSASADTIRISVNAGTPDSVSHSGGAFNGTAVFRLGGRGDATLRLNGMLDEFGFWKRELLDAEVVDLYNSGSGRDYAYIISGGGGGTVVPALEGGMLCGGFHHMSGGLA